MSADRRRRTPTTEAGEALIRALTWEGERLIKRNYKGTFDRLAESGG